jgi:gamma-glutamyl-gamma-aminobutyrate hydrolase PuuD
VSKLKVLIVGDYPSYFDAFDTKYFEKTVTSGESNPDLLCFAGGTDVNPALYGEDHYPATGRPDVHRDIFESEMFELAAKGDIPMVGICRGSQFLCVMNGGKLIQDVDNHAIGGTHEMVHYPVDGSIDCQRIQVTSTHHQMAYPFNLPVNDYDVVGWAEGLSKDYRGVPDAWPSISEAKHVEPEIVHYPKTKCLGVQGHPEYVGGDHEFHKYFNKAVLHYLFGR